MNIKDWFNSKPIWLRYGIIGAGIYPLIIIILMILSFITSPIKLNFIFETIEGILIFPAYILTSKLVINCSSYFDIDNAEKGFLIFRACYLGLTFIMTIIIGFIIGVIVGKIKSKNK